jgi:nucleoside-diphosphate-sugar epimerase
MRVLVTGGAGYVGSLLVPHLLGKGYEVTVLDRFLFRDDVFLEYLALPGLCVVTGDICDIDVVRCAMAGADAVIHMACIANDPTLDLAPELGRQINRDAFVPLVRAAREAGVRRFIYASSSSVYGVKDTLATEDMPLAAITDYSRYKADCEVALMEERAPGFATVSLRPATLCGWAPRLRLDTVPNLFVAQAVCNKEITLFGGEQMRAMLDVRDMVRCYQLMLELPERKIDGKVWNVVKENSTMADMVKMVAECVGGQPKIITTPTDDRRSYAISGDRIQRDIGWVPRYSIKAAIATLIGAILEGRVPDAMTSDVYYNVRRIGRLYA